MWMCLMSEPDTPTGHWLSKAMDRPSAEGAVRVQGVQEGCNYVMQDDT